MNSFSSLILSTHNILFLIFLIMNILDWLTGWAKARLSGTENSSDGLIGILKKVASWLIVFIGFILSYSFTVLGDLTDINMDNANLIGWFILLSLIFNEIRSILENLVQCNINIPNILIKGLKVFNDKIEEVINDEIN